MDRIYSKIIQDLRSAIVKENEEVFDVSKFGYTFRFKDNLLYSKDNEGIERFVVLFSFIQRFLRDVYKDKYHFGRDCIM